MTHTFTAKNVDNLLQSNGGDLSLCVVLAGTLVKTIGEEMLCFYLS